MKNPVRMAVLLVALAPLAQAAVPAPGTEARAWTQLQASGQAAVADLRPLPGEVADKVYQRYLDSFGQPIPESFQRESFTGGSGGSGGSR